MSCLEADSNVGPFHEERFQWKITLSRCMPLHLSVESINLTSETDSSLEKEAITVTHKNLSCTDESHNSCIYQASISYLSTPESYIHLGLVL